MQTTLMSFLYVSKRLCAPVGLKASPLISYSDRVMNTQLDAFQLIITTTVHKLFLLVKCNMGHYEVTRRKERQASQKLNVQNLTIIIIINNSIISNSPLTNK